MNVLLLGASGFIGSAVALGLAEAGHTIRAAGRDLDYGRRVLPEAEWVWCDLRRMREAGDWAKLLAGVEVVVNASGALQSGLRDRVDLVQDHAIRALIEASAQAGISHFVQISAAGAAQQASDFMQSKARADAALAASGMQHTILRPGLVIGRNAFGGNELLRAAAAMPLTGVELRGAGTIRCIALSDVVEAVVRAVSQPDWTSGSFDLVESQARPLEEIIVLHRRWLALPPPRRTLRVPVGLLRPLSLLADALGWLGWRSPLRSNAIAALAHGVDGDPAQARMLFGREPLGLPAALADMGPSGKADRWHARLALVYPLALASLVLLWLVGGIVGLVRLDAASALLVEGGFGPGAAKATVVLGSLADIAIGIAIAFRPTAKPALLAAVVVSVGYALGATFVRPDLWLDPLGALVKIVPGTALSLACLAMVEER